MMTRAERKIMHIVRFAWTTYGREPLRCYMQGAVLASIFCCDIADPDAEEITDELTFLGLLATYR